jgi:gamma-glutamyltranspeptidase/glutathione hydrolase
LSLADLSGYRPVWRDPVEFPYRGHRVIGMPPPSSGGITLAWIAGQLESTDLARLGWHSSAAIHLQVEAFRRAFAVRNRVLGDPDFVDIPLARLLSADYAAELRATTSVDRATPSMQLDPPIGGDAEGRHTTHFSVADSRGDVVALTTTLNGSHGSAVTVRGAGFLLNNEMDDFTVKPGAPNLFGLIQGEANAIEPGKRMLSSMTPTIVLDALGQPLFVTGASGGPKIITTVFLLLSGRLDYGLDVAATASAPRFHHQHLPDSIGIERDGLPEETVRSLEALGHAIRWLDPRAGSLAATIERRNGAWVGFSDPRTHGRAAGF